jgi:ribosome-binding factor A
MKIQGDSVKKAQKESLLLREISQLFLEKSMEDSELKNLFVNRVSLSSNKSTCFVFFYSGLGKAEFERVFEHLKLYKPSMRKSLSKSIQGRYVPQIVFQYDEQLQKQLEIENLIESLKSE